MSHSPWPTVKLTPSRSVCAPCRTERFCTRSIPIPPFWSGEDPDEDDRTDERSHNADGKLSGARTTRAARSAKSKTVAPPKSEAAEAAGARARRACVPCAARPPYKADGAADGDADAEKRAHRDENDELGRRTSTPTCCADDSPSAKASSSLARERSAPPKRRSARASVSASS